MIHVVVFVSVKPGMLDKVLDLYRALVAKVMADEPGCLEYSPTTDVDLGLDRQLRDPNMIVVTERWKTIEDFQAHISPLPHVAEFRAGLIETLSLKITRDAI